MKYLITCLAAAALFAGCLGDETKPTATAPEKSSPTTAEAVPVTADFEAEADETITTANYRAELIRLEDEIATE